MNENMVDKLKVAFITEMDKGDARASSSRSMVYWKSARRGGV